MTIYLVSRLLGRELTSGVNEATMPITQLENKINGFDRLVLHLVMKYICVMIIRECMEIV